MSNPPSTEPDRDEVSPRADLVAAALWITFGAAVTVGAWRMDRLERLNINPYEAPGLVPGMLGALIVLLGLALAVRAGRALGRASQEGIPGTTSSLAQPQTRPGSRVNDLRYMAAVFGLSLLYAVGLVGTGLPFWLATFVFVTAFVGLLDRDRQAALGRSTAAQWTRAAVCGAAWSAIVTLSFQHIFLVRLP